MKTNINTVIYYINLMFNSNFANEGELKYKNHDASSYFTSGACWYYSYILKNISPEGEIYIGDASVGHVIFKYENEYYDVNGKYYPKNTEKFYLDDDLRGSPSYFKTNHEEVMEMCNFLINDINEKFKKDIKRRK